MSEASKVAYLEAAAHTAMQQHMAAQAMAHKVKVESQVHSQHQQHYTLKVPQVPQPQPGQDPTTFTMVPDDGLGYDDGVRVLRSIGTWLVYLGNCLLMILYVINV